MIVPQSDERRLREILPLAISLNAYYNPDTAESILIKLGIDKLSVICEHLRRH
jgi:hypothetical protein